MFLFAVNEIGDDGTIELAELLTKNTTIVDINLGGECGLCLHVVIDV